MSRSERPRLGYGANKTVLRHITQSGMNQHKPIGGPSVLQIISSVAVRDGGPSRAATSINRSLNEHGVDTLLLTTNADGPKGKSQHSTALPVRVNNGAVWYSKRSRPYRIKNSWSLAYRAVRLARTCDIVHLHGVYEANSVYAYVAARVTGRPYVLQPHGTLEPYQQRQGRRHKAIWNALIGHRIVRGATLVIAASSSEARNIQAQYPTAQAAVIPLGVTMDHATIGVNLPSSLERWLDAPKEQRFVFLGRLAQKKRPDLLVQAWATLPPEIGHLLIVGPPQDWTPVQLRQFLPAAAAASVTFLDEVPPDLAATILSQSGVFVLPSENENFGIAVVEAMAHGCAILATKETAATEHVLASDGGRLILDTAPKALGRQIEELLGDPNLIKNLGDRAMDYARTHLSWGETAKRLISVYQAVLK